MKNKNLIKQYICPICKKKEEVFTPLEPIKNVPCLECQRKEKK